eukprot:gene15353-16929_t
MFFAVKYGQNEQQLFNSHCRIKILLENIRKRCNCSPNDVIDLADEQAFVKNLAEQPHFKYASLVLQQPGASYILIKVEERGRDGLKLYTPLLEGLEASNPEFISRLANKKVNPNAGVKDGWLGKDGFRTATRTGKRKKTLTHA